MIGNDVAAVGDNTVNNSRMMNQPLDNNVIKEASVVSKIPSADRV